MTLHRTRAFEATGVSTGDQILSARIAAVVNRHTARGRIDGLGSAVAELRGLAGDRPDLLAEVAGVALGLAEADPSMGPRYRAEAELARAAGADKTQIPAWIKVGRERAAQARLTPYSGASGPALMAVVTGMVLIERSASCQTRELP
jgi:hypothetical protein